ncbi:MAG: KH domain-containing protein [Patescibacteria group bacterium]
MELDQKFVEDVVKSIVSHPEDVKTVRTIDERGVLITLSINPADMGYVIGRQGQTARAIRTLLKIVGAKNNARVNLKINEPEGSTHVRRSDNRNDRNDHVDIDTSDVDNLRI